LRLTIIRKITGDIPALRDELRGFLNKKDEDVKINSLTQHVIVKVQSLFGKTPPAC
jgi:large subunit ribosomal protein L49